MRREIVRDPAIDRVECPKSLLSRSHDPALDKQLHMVAESGLGAVEVLQNVVRAQTALFEHFDDLHSVVVAECFADRNEFLFFHVITVVCTI